MAFFPEKTACFGKRNRFTRSHAHQQVASLFPRIDSTRASKKKFQKLAFFFERRARHCDGVRVARARNSPSQAPNHDHLINIIIALRISTSSS